MLICGIDRSQCRCQCQYQDSDRFIHGFRVRRLAQHLKAFFSFPGDSSTHAGGEQRIVMQDPNEKIGPRTDPMFVSPAGLEATQTAKSTQTTPQTQAGIFGKLVLVGWLRDAGKDVIFVQIPRRSAFRRSPPSPTRTISGTTWSMGRRGAWGQVKYRCLVLQPLCAGIVKRVPVLMSAAEERSVHPWFPFGIQRLKAWFSFPG